MRTSKQTFKVVMLPTGKKATLNLGISGVLHNGYSHPENDQYKNEHLYIISNENIKDEDKVLNTFHPQEGIINAGKDYSISYLNLRKERYKKIIASTDKHLGELFPFPWLNEQFVNAYVKAYNEGKPITEVDLEMYTETEYGLGIDCSVDKIKTRPDGSVIIHHSKKYSQEELNRLVYATIQEMESLAGSHYNWAPKGFRETTVEEFARRFYMYILKPQCAKQIHRDAEGNQLKESFTSIRFWEIAYKGWENMGFAMAYDNKKQMRYFIFGEEERWEKNTRAFAAQFAGDNS